MHFRMSVYAVCIVYSAVFCYNVRSIFIDFILICHRLGQGKSGRQRGTATDQMDKRGTLHQEDTVVHESGCRILPTQPHMGPMQVISRSRAPSSCKQSRRDQDVRRTSKRCH